ncbi:MAG: DUF929 family protein [Candidatus Micrarchaeota archaeon]|nr:DUF929 family protein [Candidatus Micrarchaeota archaeon]
MAPKNESAQAAQRKLERTVRQLRTITYTALVLGIIGILIGVYPLLSSALKGQAVNYGHTLSGINAPLTPQQLAVINNASNSYFEQAGEMYLNNPASTNATGVKATQTNSIIVNGKPSVIYLGAISCIFCGENRWAMALALAKFGQFGALYNGYSSVGDGDVPTLYWLPAQYNASAGTVFGANYTSSYINFLPMEGQSKITGGFVFPTLQSTQSDAQSFGNPAYVEAVNAIAAQNNYAGTPYTIWGRNIVPGADAVAGFAQLNNSVALTYMTHAQVLSQLAKPNDTFAWTQYVGADIYIAMMCGTLNNTAPICSLPAIKSIEAQEGY